MVAIGAAVGIATWSRRQIVSLDRPMIAADRAAARTSLRLHRRLRRLAGVLARRPPRGLRRRLPEGKRTLWVRSLDSADPREIESSDDAMFPFWSPDGRSLGFFAHGKLKTVDASGGVPIAIADAPDARGGSWSDENVIVYTPETRAGLYRVAANGRRARPR